MSRQAERPYENHIGEEKFGFRQNQLTTDGISIEKMTNMA